MTGKRRPGKAAKYAIDPVTHTPVVGLMIDRSTGQHYTRLSRTKKKFFGADIVEAVSRYKAWQAAEKGETVQLRSTHTLDMSRPDYWDILAASGSNEPTTVTLHDVDEDAFWLEVKRRLHAGPADFARRVGEPRIARLDDLTPLEESLTFDQVWDAYTSRRKKLTKEWLRKQRQQWRQFADATGKATLAEVSQDDVRRYDNVLEVQGQGRSGTWRNHRISTVRSILDAVLKQKKDTDRCRKVLAFCESWSVTRRNVWTRDRSHAKTCTPSWLKLM